MKFEFVRFVMRLREADILNAVISFVFELSQMELLLLLVNIIVQT